MLLSHNFDITPDIAPPLSREDFAEVFRLGLSAHESCQCSPLNHPHWMVEILFPLVEFTPQRVGELCAQAMVDKRQPQRASDASSPTVLILGGLKTTPASSPSPSALQPGNWGVDVVETLSGEAFLQLIGWQAAIAQKPADSIFKVERHY